MDTTMQVLCAGAWFNGSVNIPGGLGKLELVPVPSKEGATWMGVSEEDKAAMLEKDPESKGKPYKTEPYFTLKFKEGGRLRGYCTFMSEKSGYTAEQYFKELEEMQEAEPAAEDAE